MNGQSVKNEVKRKKEYNRLKKNKKSQTGEIMKMDWKEQLKIDPTCFKKIKPEDQTEELCRLAIHQDPSVLRFIENPSDEVIELAVSKQAKTLKYVPFERQTQSLVQMALKQTKTAIQFVNPSLITLEDAQLAVKRYKEALKYIPKELQTETICLKAIEKNPFIVSYIQQWTHKVALKAVEQEGRFLHFIPDEFKTDTVIQKALQHSPQAILSLIHSETITFKQEYGLIVLRQDGMMLKPLIEALKFQQTDASLPLEWVTTAVKQNGLALEFVPFEFKTEAICSLAYHQNKRSLAFIPAKYITEKMFEDAFREDVTLLKTADQFITKQRVLYAIKQDPTLFRWIHFYHSKIFDSFELKDWEHCLRLGIPLEKFKLLEKVERNDDRLYGQYAILREVLGSSHVQRYLFGYYEPFMVQHQSLFFTFFSHPNLEEWLAFHQEWKNHPFYQEQKRQIAKWRTRPSSPSRTKPNDDSFIKGLVYEPMRLAFLPPQMKTYQVCRIAVSQENRAKYFSPFHVFADPCMEDLIQPKMRA